MSETVLVALITTFGNLSAIFLARWLSHREHKETKEDVRQIKAALNGRIASK